MTAASVTRSVLVVGDGVVGLAAAIALRRVLPNAAIRLVQLPGGEGSWLNRLGAASPAIHRFHRQIGLDPRLFARRTSAEPVHLRLYRRDGQPPVREASTATIPFVEGVPLHHIWLRRRRETGDAAPDFAAMLLALREAHGDERGLGARFDAEAYHTLLGEMAAALNIDVAAAADVVVTTENGAIAGVAADEGEVLAADLYVDAAGPRSRLLTAIGAGWTDWSGWLPTLSLSMTAAGGGAPGEERLTYADGAIAWQTRRWRAELTPDAAAPAPGCLDRHWRGNAVAVGEAAVRAPFGDGVGLGHALEDILRLIALLPRPGGDGHEPREYDRRTAAACRALAGWSSLTIAPDAAGPPGLAETIAAFAARGRVVVDELDPIPPGAWLARLMALGPAPRRVDPTAWALPDATMSSTIARAEPARRPDRITERGS
jgi:tryptophan halogenase